jgi:glucose dehydrogenase
VYALDAYNGNKLWNYTTDDRMRSSPVISNNILYVGTRAGSLYALGNLDAASGKSFSLVNIALVSITITVIVAAALLIYFRKHWHKEGQL